MMRRWKTALQQSPAMFYSLALLFAVMLGWGASELYRRAEDGHFRMYLDGVVQREALKLESATMNGTAMGMATMLGLNEPILKQLATGARKPDDSAALQRMQVARLLAAADGVYVLNNKGVVVAHETEDAHSTGADFSFRPFWQLGMQGVSSAYPAVGTLSHKRGVYVTAPLYASNMPNSETLGVVVIKLSAENLLQHLRDLGERALLVSPQGVVFASTDDAWLFKLVSPLTSSELGALRALQQFGASFSEKQSLGLLPFDLTKEDTYINGERYFRARASLQWKDPEGRWYLMALAPPGDALPLWKRMLLGGAVAALVFVSLVMVLRGMRDMAARRDALAQSEAATRELGEAAELKAQQSALTLKLQDARELSALATTFFQRLNAFLPVHQGSLYFLERGNGEDAALHLAGSFGTSAPPATIALGEGLLGQCALDRRAMAVTDVPAGFWRVASGTGEAQPKHLLLLPITRQSELLGVVEVASLNRGLIERQDEIEALVPVLGMNLDVLLAERRSEQLLTTAQATAQEYRRQQEYSQSMEAWYQSVLYGAPDGILVADDTGTIVLSNRLAQEIFGYQDGEMQGLSVEQLLPEVMRQAHTEMRESFSGDLSKAKNMAMWRSGLTGLRKDGQPIALSISLAAIAATAYRGHCVCAVVRPH